MDSEHTCMNGDPPVVVQDGSVETVVTAVENKASGNGKRNAQTRPPLLEESLDGADGTLQEPNFRAANSRIQQLIEEKSKNVRSGPQYEIVREMPKWQTSADLRHAAAQPVNWAVKNLWTQKAKILMAAEQKTGKTFLVCHIAMCVSSGTNLFGCDKFEVLEPGPVGIVAGEDDEGEIGRRLDRMFRASGMLMSNYPIHFLPAHNLRLNRERAQDYMRKSVRDLGLKLIVYDPLARLMDGDENSKEIVSAVLNPASALAKDEEVSVMVVHHLGKQNSDNPKTAIARVRGSSDITSWFSCGIFISGQMRLGRLSIEILQRTSGDIPNEFPVEVKEDQNLSVHGLGAMRLIAHLDEDDRDRSGRNEQMIEDAADAIAAGGKNRLTIPDLAAQYSL